MGRKTGDKQNTEKKGYSPKKSAQSMRKKRSVVKELLEEPVVKELLEKQEEKVSLTRSSLFDNIVHDEQERPFVPSKTVRMLSAVRSKMEGRNLERVGMDELADLAQARIGAERLSSEGKVEKLKEKRHSEAQFLTALRTVLGPASTTWSLEEVAGAWKEQYAKEENIFKDKIAKNENKENEENEENEENKVNKQGKVREQEKSDKMEEESAEIVEQHELIETKEQLWAVVCREMREMVPENSDEEENTGIAAFTDICEKNEDMLARKFDIEEWEPGKRLAIRAFKFITKDWQVVDRAP